MPTYKKNFLTDVICRIDFPTILEISKDTPEKFQKEIIADFPILEPLKHMALQFEAKKDAPIATTQLDKTVWRFKTKDSDYVVELDPEFLVIVAKKYTDYTLFKAKIEKVLQAFFKSYPSTVVQRLGLRYIDQIEIPGETDFFNWSKYINKNLIQNLDFFTDKQKIKRAMQFFEISVDDDTRINLRAGIYNGNYPESVTKKEFVLDYDCFTHLSLEKEAILPKVDTYNQILTEYFEASINEDFRKLLNS